MSDQLPPGKRIHDGLSNLVFSTNWGSPVIFPIQEAIAFPKTYFDILPRVSAETVTVTVGAAVVLLADTERGMLAFLGAKSSKKQLLFCGKTDSVEINIIIESEILRLKLFISQ
jgi:hypothetical protein